MITNPAHRFPVKGSEKVWCLFYRYELSQTLIYSTSIGNFQGTRLVMLQWS